MQPEAQGTDGPQSPALRTPRSFLLDEPPLPADDSAPLASSDSFSLVPPVSEVVKMRRVPAGEMPLAERAPALREAAVRASRAPAVEIIARLSSERTKLKTELSQAQRERDEVLRELPLLRTKLATYEQAAEPFALADSGEVVAQLRAELAARDAEREAKEASHQELARLAVERLRAERSELEARTNELATFRASLAARDEEVATLRADLANQDDRIDAAIAGATEALRADAAAAAVEAQAALADAGFAKADAEAARADAEAARADAEAARAELAQLRAEVAARDELLQARERIDQEAHEADAAALRSQAVEIEDLRAALAVAGQCAHDAEIAALRAAFEERTAEVDGLRAALDAAAAQPCGHDETLDALRAEIEAQIAQRTADFAQHVEERDELDRLRRHCADLEQETVRSAALEADFQAMQAALESRTSEADALREKLAAVEKEHAALRALAEAKPAAAALEAREERSARANRALSALAFGFGGAKVLNANGESTADSSDRGAPTRRRARRFDDGSSLARPYPTLDPKPQRAAARMEKALRRMDRKLAKLGRLIKEHRTIAIAAPAPAPVVTAQLASPAPAPVSAPAPRPRGSVGPSGGGMFAKGGGMLGALIQANLALRASADDSTGNTEKRGNNQ